MKKPFQTLAAILFLSALILFFTTAHAWTSSLPPLQETSPTPGPVTATPSPSPLTPADLINAVNTLRMANGLYALNAHPVLITEKRIAYMGNVPCDSADYLAGRRSPMDLVASI